LTSKSFARACGELALEKRAEDVTLIDLRKLGAATDFFVICTGSGDRHVRGIADYVTEEMSKRGIRAWHVEGYSSRKWILIDFVDVVVHVFNSDTRKFYSLETLWGDAPSEVIKPRIRRSGKA